MNTRAIVLLSVVCNAVLVAWAIPLHKGANPIAAHTSNAQDRTEIAGETAWMTRTNVRLETLVVTNPVSDQFTWAQVESQHYKDYIARLRAIECPEQTIRDIITRDVNKLYALKQKELRSRGSPAGMIWRLKSR